jgi:hypothetical protein
MVLIISKVGVKFMFVMLKHSKCFQVQNRRFRASERVDERQQTFLMYIALQ